MLSTLFVGIIRTAIERNRCVGTQTETLPLETGTRETARW